MLRFFLFILVLLLQGIATTPLQAQPQNPPQIAASIKPLQLIAKAVTNGISEPSLIIGEGQDPHHPSMRPSERQVLAGADIVLWVGPALETALTRAIESESADVITAHELIGEAGLAIAGGNDPHIWLSTGNVRLIARALVQKLIELDAVNQARYENNLSLFLASLDDLDREINNALEGLRERPFAVYHNAFQYYERQFGLRHIVSFTDAEELQPGVRRITEVRALLEDNAVSCLLLEPGNNPSQVTRLSGRPMRVVSIDVLGFAYTLSADAYVEFMRDLTFSLAGCLEA